MKKLLSLLALVLCFACGMRGEESQDYAVKTTKAPVWIYQDATSTVAGYLDYGAQPESEVDENDPQWIHVKSGNIEGWSHILAFCHRASDPEDLDLAPVPPAPTRPAPHSRHNTATASILSLPAVADGLQQRREGLTESGQGGFMIEWFALRHEPGCLGYSGCRGRCS